jgi:hypothetical protein
MYLAVPRKTRRRDCRGANEFAGLIVQTLVGFVGACAFEGPSAGQIGREAHKPGFPSIPKAKDLVCLSKWRCENDCKGHILERV